MDLNLGCLVFLTSRQVVLILGSMKCSIDLKNTFLFSNGNITWPRNLKAGAMKVTACKFETSFGTLPN